MTVVKHTLIQWNCRGFRSNYEEILNLLNDNSAAILCLQETFLKDSDIINIRNYTCTYNNFVNNNDRPSGGVAIFVDSKLPCSTVPLTTKLQAVAMRVTLHKAITVCSIYIPPNYNLGANELNDLHNQLPQPCILMGDFNGHNILWGSPDTNERGNKLERFLLDNNLCLMNDKRPTYMHAATRTFTHLDLSICHPDLFLDFAWNTGDDLCGSDHYPIFIAHQSDQDRVNSSKWKLDKADWAAFIDQAETLLTSESLLDTEDPISEFSNILISIADECIPKSTNSNKPKKSWFTKECDVAVKTRKTSLKRFRARPLLCNLQQYQILRAKARRTTKFHKRKSWKEYVSKLNCNTSTKKVWDMIRKISGKGKTGGVGHLNVNNDKITDLKEITNTLATTFEKYSSTNNYSAKFQKFKKQAEKGKLNFASNNLEDYNCPFSFDELSDSLKKASDTATGPDNIHYQFLKHLPFVSKHALLSIFNDIFTSGKCPDSWKYATVIPLPKPEKDNSNPVNYRPIALTSCVCKTLERMINSRLVWYLETKNIISPLQSGFRSKRSTNDHLVRLESFIRDAFLKKEHLVAVFFDLEKAYDTTWKYGIMKDLHESGLRGYLPNFISSFLSNRKFNVRVNDSLSDVHKQEMGVPQGSILSVTLFGLKINSIVKCISPGIDGSLYVDDFLICYRSKNMNTIERQLQQCLNRIQTWSDENGFKFSKTKTNCVHFCQLRKQHDDPSLKIDGVDIPVVDEMKFLGIIFDKKLSFIPHLKKLKAKCIKALNLLKVVSNTNWGADRIVLLRLYRSIIRSKLDYGSIVYGSARPSYLQMLDPIHHQGLRIALGAFRTSPAHSLYVEANEPSLYSRREKLSMQFAIQIKSNPSNPTYDVVFNPNYKELYDSKPKVISPFGVRIAPLIEEADINLDDIKCESLQDPEDDGIQDIAPWKLKNVRTDLSLSNSKKADTLPCSFLNSFHIHRSRFQTYTDLYTDGSKDGEKVAAAVVHENDIISCRLPNNASIFSAEVKAIDLALNYISEERFRKSIIYCDSLSVVQSILHRNFKNVLIRNMFRKYDYLFRSLDIIICWIPSHIGIPGNEKVDKAAKLALSLDITNIKIPYTDFKPCIYYYLKTKWQSEWDMRISKLYPIKNKIGESANVCRNIRREEVILARLRIGHTYITHSYLLKREDQPWCVGCDEFYTVEHFMIKCIDTSHIREQYFSVNSMKNLFSDVNPDCIIEYVKEIGLYYKI